MSHLHPVRGVHPIVQLHAIQVCCQGKATGATPRLTVDDVLGPDNLTSPTTDYVYTLIGPTHTHIGSWIRFEFISPVSLTSVILRYYSNDPEQPPQLWFRDFSNAVSSPISPPRNITEQRQCLVCDVKMTTTMIDIEVIQKGNPIHISEVQFYEQGNYSSNCSVR